MYGTGVRPSGSWLDVGAPELTASQVCGGRSAALEQAVVPPIWTLMTNFSELNLGPKVLKAIEEAGYTTPTPIQLGAIPPALEGRDVLVQGC